MAVFTLETDTPSSKSVKIDGKRMDKVRRIVHPKLRPFHFQINQQLMNSAFVGYEELSRSRRVLSTSAFGLCGSHPPRSA